LAASPLASALRRKYEGKSGGWASYTYIYVFIVAHRGAANQPVDGTPDPVTTQIYLRLMRSNAFSADWALETLQILRTYKYSKSIVSKTTT
jgi:hypothetical protein